MLSRHRQPSAAARQRWLQQLAILLEAGIALHPALSLLALQQPDNECAYWQPVLAGIEQGLPLSRALAQCRGFSHGDLALLAIAEQAGRLDRQLARLAGLQVRRLALHAQIRRTLRYPLLVLLAALLVSGFLLTSVVPGFASLYRSFGAELPWLTRQVLALSALLQALWLPLLLMFAGLLGATVWLWRQRAGWRRGVHRLLWHLPVTGALAQAAWLGQWHRALHETLLAGLPFVNALEQAERLVSESPLAAAQSRLQRAVHGGRRLSEAMREEPMYPPACARMIAIGEESGMLVALLLALAGQFEEDLDNRCGQAMKLLEPLLMAGLGILVGIIVMALYLPLFQLGQVI